MLQSMVFYVCLCRRFVIPSSTVAQFIGRNGFNVKNIVSHSSVSRYDYHYHNCTVYHLVQSPKRFSLFITVVSSSRTLA